MSPLKATFGTPEISSCSAKTGRNHTNLELRAWCYRADAVAACFVRDVLRLNEICDAQKETIFWYLGTVPCRNVELVGIIVGVKVNDKMTTYTLDDGTGVIHCFQSHSQRHQQSEKESRTVTSAATTSVGNIVHKPQFEVGETVSLTGRVTKWMDYKQIFINSIESVWPHKESDNWIRVSLLHQTYYSKPFVIPPLPPTVPKTPVKRAASSQLKTPSTKSTTLTTPSSASTTSSAHNSVSASTATGPPRLRHPSRLHSKDHQAQIFKMYLNHFIHSAHNLTTSDLYSRCDEPELEPEDKGRHHFVQAYGRESPTKRLRKLYHDNNNDATPKASRPRSMLDVTPKPSTKFGAIILNASAMPPSAIQSQTPTKGFTLSYLRRVPELSQLAYAVVRRELKVRQREARKSREKAKLAGLAVTQLSEKQRRELEEPPKKKVKRLFKWAINELRRDGAIVVRESFGWQNGFPPPTSILWRKIWKAVDEPSWDKTESFAEDTFNTTTGITTSLRPFGEVEDEGYLSDPPVNGEESFIPLISSLLHVPVERAIKTLSERHKRILREGQLASASTSTLGSTKFPKSFSYQGPTVQEIKDFLVKSDDQWMFVGEYAIMDALKGLCAPGVERVHKLGDRWKLTLGTNVR